VTDPLKAPENLRRKESSDGKCNHPRVPGDQVKHRMPVFLLLCAATGSMHRRGSGAVPATVGDTGQSSTAITGRDKPAPSKYTSGQSGRAWSGMGRRVPDTGGGGKSVRTCKSIGNAAEIDGIYT